MNFVQRPIDRPSRSAYLANERSFARTWFSIGFRLETASTNQSKILSCSSVSHLAHLRSIDQNLTKYLRHGSYLATLPARDALRTPLHYSDEELELLRGTNIYSATIDRRTAWKSEWAQLLIVVSQVDQIWAQEVTWYAVPTLYNASLKMLLMICSQGTISCCRHFHLLPGFSCFPHVQ